MLPRRVSSLFWERFRSRNAMSTAELVSFPDLSVSDQRRILGEKLLKQMQYFGAREDALPEWRELAGLTDPEALWRVWPSLPVIDKQTLTQRFPADKIGMRFGLTGQVRSTGGSTGEPTHFFHDEGLTRACNASALYAQQQIGWRPGMPIIKIWGSERDIGKASSWHGRLSNAVLNVKLIDGYALDRRTADEVFSAIRRHRSVAVTGFSSMLSYVAESLVKRGLRLPGHVTAAWSAGEMLLPQYVANFRAAFDCTILNLYGGRELSVMAFQHHEDGPLMIARPWLFIELLDRDNRAVKPGEVGRVVCTSTVSRGTPFLRYDIGDLAMAEGACYTEAGIGALCHLAGRSAGLLTLSDGRVINNLYWNHLFKDIAEVEQFQVVIETDRRITILLKGRKLSPHRELALLETVRIFLGSEVQITIRWVDSIPLTRQGKLVQVIRQPG